MSPAVRSPFCLPLGAGPINHGSPNFPPPCFLLPMLSINLNDFYRKSNGPINSPAHFNTMPDLSTASVCLHCSCKNIINCCSTMPFISASLSTKHCVTQECNNTVNACSHSSCPFQPIKKQQQLLKLHKTDTGTGWGLVVLYPFTADYFSSR